jgi:UDP-N-acetylmuramoyl-tripeptide--D-alanyl-D-alanine ligase
VENIHIDKKGTTLDIRARDRVITKLTWPIAGQSGVTVLSFVGSVGLLSGCTDDEIREGLRVAGEQTPRMRRVAAGKRILLDDTYNAAPESMLGALETLRYSADGRPTVAVLGDMKELGEFSSALHDTVGEAAAHSGLSALYTYGESARMIADAAKRCGMLAVSCFGEGEIEELAQAVAHGCARDAVILFKAAHSMRLGRAVAAVRRLS